MKARLTHPLAAAVLSCFLPPAMAQTAAAAAPTVTTAAAAGATATPATPTSSGTAAGTSTTAATLPERRPPPATRLTNEFATLAGSPENASALINGLRSGSAITLNAPAPSGGGGSTTGTTTASSATFTAPNGPMSYGNIRIALSLARAQLARDGIANPTPQQLQAALVGSGGSSGILDRRAAGIGWGRIAHDMGMKLGPVLSGHGPKVRSITTATAAGTAPAKASHRGEHAKPHHRSDIVTAAGGGGRHAVKATAEHEHHHAEHHQSRHAAPATPRVVTAAGTTTTPTYQGGGRAGSAGGVVTASGGGADQSVKKGAGHGKT